MTSKTAPYKCPIPPSQISGRSASIIKPNPAAYTRDVQMGQCHFSPTTCSPDTEILQVDGDGDEFSWWNGEGDRGGDWYRRVVSADAQDIIPWGDGDLEVAQFIAGRFGDQVRAGVPGDKDFRGDGGIWAWCGVSCRGAASVDQG